MGKLIDDTPRGGAPIGEERLLEFIDEMNTRRAAKGFRQRYKPVRNDENELTMTEWMEIEPRLSGHRPSRRYSHSN